MEVDSRDHEQGPLLCRVAIGFEQLDSPPTASLNNTIRLDGIKPKRSFPIHIDALFLRRLSDSKLTIIFTTIYFNSY